MKNYSHIPKTVSHHYEKSMKDLALIDFVLSLKDTIDGINVQLEELRGRQLADNLELAKLSTKLSTLQKCITPEILNNLKKKYV